MTVFEEVLTQGIGVSDELEIDLQAFVEALFNKTCKAVRTRTEMSADDRQAFETEAANFAGSLQKIGKIADKALQRAALDAVGAALALGFYHAGNGGVVSELRAQATERARKALRAKAEPKVELRRAAIAAICEQKGWRGNEANLPKLVARELDKLPKLKSVSKSARTVADDLKATFATLSELQRKP